MTHDDIRRVYDQDPMMTLRRLSLITGYSVAQLKEILHG